MKSLPKSYINIDEIREKYDVKLDRKIYFDFWVEAYDYAEEKSTLHNCEMFNALVEFAIKIANKEGADINDFFKKATLGFENFANRFFEKINSTL